MTIAVSFGWRLKTILSHIFSHLRMVRLVASSEIKSTYFFGRYLSTQSVVSVQTGMICK